MNTQTKQIKIPFEIEVDDYSVVSITGGYALATSSIEPVVSFIAQVGNITTSFPSVIIVKLYITYRSTTLKTEMY